MCVRSYFRSRKRRCGCVGVSRIAGCILLLIALPALTGCSRKETEAERLARVMHKVQIKYEKPVDPMSGLPVVPHFAEPLARSSGLGEIGSRGAAVPSVDVANEQALNYYTTICDVYWKLNWMRRELLRGIVPYNMEDEIEKARKKLETVTHDGNYELAAEAMDRLEKGLEHLACLRTMRVAGIDERSVPWNSDGTTVQQYLERRANDSAVTTFQLAPDRGTDDDEEDGAPHVRIKKSLPEALPSAAHMQAVNMALDYVSRYHASPRELMQREWELAIRKTNRLRDNLYLKNRTENKDGDSTDVGNAVLMAIGSPEPIHMPRDAGTTASAPAGVVSRNLQVQ